MSYFEADSGHVIGRRDSRMNMILHFRNENTVNEIMDNRSAINMGDDRRLFITKISDLPPQITLEAPTLGRANLSDYRNNEALSPAFVNIQEQRNIVSFRFNNVEEANTALHSDIEVNGEKLNLFVSKESRYSKATITLFLGGIPLNTPNDDIFNHPDITGNLIQIKEGKENKFAFLYCTELEHANSLVANGLTINNKHIKPEDSGITTRKDDTELALTIYSENSFSDDQLASIGSSRTNQIEVRNGYITFINDISKEEAKKLILNGVNIDGKNFKVNAKRESVLTKIFRFPLDIENSDIEHALDGQMYNLYQGKTHKLGFVSFFDEVDANAFESVEVNGQTVSGEMKVEMSPKERTHKHVVFANFNGPAFSHLTPEMVLESKPFKVLNSKHDYYADTFLNKNGQVVGVIRCKNYFAASDLVDEGLQMDDGKWVTVNLKSEEERKF